MQFSQKCTHCGAKIIGKRADAKFCSAKCRKSANLLRKNENQFETTARLLAFGYHNNNYDVIKVGLLEKKELFDEPESGKTEDEFNLLVDKHHFSFVLEKIIEVVYQVFENSEITEKELMETSQMIHDNLIFFRNNQKIKIPSEVWRMIDGIEKEIHRMLVNARLSKAKKAFIDNGDEFRGQLVELFARFCQSNPY